MTLEFTAYTAIYLPAVVLSLVAAAYAFPSRATAGGRWVLLMSGAMAVWCAAEALDFSSMTIHGHVLAAQLSYLGATTAPVFYFLFAVEYSGRWRWLPWGTVAGLFVLPALTIAAGFTNAWHHLVWTSFTPLAGAANVIVYGHGPVYWAITIYSLLLALIGTVFVVDTAIKSRGIYRARSIVIVTAAVFPWVGQLAYSMVPTALAGLDPSLTLSVTCALIAVAIARYRLLDLVPVPREVLVEEMGDGIVVLDGSGRVLETNPAAVALLGLDSAPQPGSPSSDMFATWSQAGRDAVRAVYEDRSTTLESPQGAFIGVERSRIGGLNGLGERDLFVLRDITGQVRAERALQDAYRTLQSRMIEIERLQAELLEQATHDSLTGLHNRRYLDEELTRELARAERAGSPVSLLMLDVDHFKDVNDTYGHATGDRVLRAIAHLLQEVTRAGDMTCRLGGDEFVVVLPEATTEDAVSRAEDLRRILRESMCDGCDDRVRPTVSVGVAAYPLHADGVDRLMAAADRALYASKGAGRDRVSVAVAAAPVDGEPAGS